MSRTYIVLVNEKFVAPQGLVSRRSMASRFTSGGQAIQAGCAATCDPYNGDVERAVAWDLAHKEGRFQVLDAATLQTFA